MPIEGTRPAWRTRSLKAQDVNWVDSIGRCNTSIAEVWGGDDACAAAAGAVVSGAGAVAGAADGGVARGPGAVLGSDPRGLKTEDAAREAGVSSPVAFRWFRHAGGVNPCLPPEVSGRYLSFVEREEIALLRAQQPVGRT